MRFFVTGRCRRIRVFFDFSFFGRFYPDLAGFGRIFPDLSGFLASFSGLNPAFFAAFRSGFRCRRCMASAVGPVACEGERPRFDWLDRGGDGTNATNGTNGGCDGRGLRATGRC